MINSVKVEFYDDFSCIAERCSFTCCEDWDISIDHDTYNKWMKDEEQSGALGRNVRVTKHRKNIEYYIKMGPHRHCPFLNRAGLCDIVIDCGDDYLPKTCRMFPRQENNLKDFHEFSLSCACPSVVDIINNIKGKISFTYEVDESIRDNLEPEYHIRKAMIAMMQNSILPLKDRIVLVFHMLSSVRKEPLVVDELLIRCREDDYLLSLAGMWSGIEIDYNDSWREINELFVDITQNYQKEKKYSKYLKNLLEFSENMSSVNNLTQWTDFIVDFGQYERLIENCIVSKIFADCISEDINELIIAFQIVIIEYLMVRYSVFVYWLMNNNMDYNVIKDYIVIFSRIIGYNQEGIREFWKDSFDEAVWELGYLLLLTR